MGLQLITVGVQYWNIKCKSTLKGIEYVKHYLMGCTAFIALL
uniref:Uncharacterized protein n=1 Tax=Anguilla anguilla TaxID=7936 RepID=A0A0E9XGF5_ANGAN